MLFVRLRQKYRDKSIAQLVRAIQVKCPDLSREAIVNHEAWYRTYLQLREKQRQAVQEWRQRKQQQQSISKSTSLPAFDCSTKPKSPPPTVQTPVSSSNRPASSGKENSPLDHLLKVSQHKKEEIERKKQLVKQWKAQRDIIRLAEEQRLKNQLKASKESEEMKRKARAAKLKQALEEYKQQQISETTSAPVRVLSSNYPNNKAILQLYRYVI